MRNPENDRSRASGYPENGDYQCAKIKIGKTSVRYSSRLFKKKTKSFKKFSELKHMNITFVTVVRECFAPDQSCSEIYKEAEDIGAPHPECQTCNLELCNSECVSDFSKSLNDSLNQNSTELADDFSPRIQSNFYILVLVFLQILNYFWR